MLACDVGNGDDEHITVYQALERRKVNEDCLDLLMVVFVSSLKSPKLLQATRLLLVKHHGRARVNVNLQRARYAIHVHGSQPPFPE